MLPALAKKNIHLNKGHEWTNLKPLPVVIDGLKEVFVGHERQVEQDGEVVIVADSSRVYTNKGYFCATVAAVVVVYTAVAVVESRFKIFCMLLQPSRKRWRYLKLFRFKWNNVVHFYSRPKNCETKKIPFSRFHEVEIFKGKHLFDFLQMFWNKLQVIRISTNLVKWSVFLRRPETFVLIVYISKIEVIFVIIQINVKNIIGLR